MGQDVQRVAHFHKVKFCNLGQIMSLCHISWEENVKCACANLRGQGLPVVMRYQGPPTLGDVSYIPPCKDQEGPTNGWGEKWGARSEVLPGSLLFLLLSYKTQRCPYQFWNSWILY